MAKHETFNAFMTALIAYAPLVGVIAYFAGEQRILLSGLFSSCFWLSVIGYFVWDYRKTHIKPKVETVFSPLALDKAVIKESKETEPTRFRKYVNYFFFVLETFEATFFLLLTPLSWQTFEINGIPVLTYYNALFIGLFALGVILAMDITHRLRNPEKRMEYF